jgi:hypothetical protein
MSGEKNIEGYLDSEDKIDMPIRWMKMVLLVYKYISEPTIVNIFVAQSNRVAEYFRKAEETIANNNPKYTHIDLEDSWRRFIRTRYEETMTHIENKLTSYMTRIEAVLAPYDPSGDAKVPGRVTRREKIQMLRAAIDGRRRWQNPFT